MSGVGSRTSSGRWKAPTALGVAAVVVAGAGWFGLRQSGVLDDGSGDGYVAAPVTNAAPAKVSVANGASGVTPDTSVVLTAPVGETIGSVTLADAGAHAVAGTYSADRKTWTSAANLRVADTYQLIAETNDPSVNGVGLQHESFSTANEENNIKFDDMYPIDGSTVGVGQPVVLEFENPVPKADRANVERALTVYSSPEQPGSWGWLSDQRVDYRPENYWKPGTKVHVAMNLSGVRVGDGLYGAKDHSLDFTVGRDQETLVNLASDHATVYRDGQEVHSFAVTGGMPGLDTWAGTYAVIDKASDIRMDSRTAGLGDAYDIPDVKWDVHFTYSGSYIHSAPWSESAQGNTNVSHGCVGTNPDDAEWFYDSTLPGDIIRVVNSARTGALGNGFNDWQESWTQWQAESAL
ncbi:MAG TPA: Ig-like domain-containing protein [Actinospica sp.]|nr:Ig-like domain-containing protein [Actinospica sp.]